MAQSGTGWQLLRRSSSPISELRNDLAPFRKTRRHSRHRRGFWAIGSGVPERGFAHHGSLCGWAHSVAKWPHFPGSGGVYAPAAFESSERGCRPAPGAPGRSSHALRFSGSARSPGSQASTGTLKGAGNDPLMHPVLELIRSTRVGGFEDCTKVPKIAGSLRVQSSAPSCNLRQRPRCLATTRYDRDNPDDRRNPLDPPSVSRFQSTTRWSSGNWSWAECSTARVRRRQGHAHTCFNAGPIRIRAEIPSVTRKRAFLNHA
jgi:hypothetical protein